MSAVTRPRGPLPRRVYWFRRLLVLVVAFGLVVGIARLLDVGGGGSSDRAAQAAARSPEGGGPSVAPASGGAEQPRRKDRKQRKDRKERREERRALAQPDGPCMDSDVVVTPLARSQPAGQRVRLTLEVGTLEAAACTWEVSPNSVFVNISDEELGLLWTSQHCADAVPTREVVARKEKPARVHLAWDGRESDEECTGTAPWVTSGSYLVEAVARGSTELQEAVFVLGPAVAPTITMTPTPTPTGGTDAADRTKKKEPADRPQT